MSSKTSMDTDTLHITQETLFNKIEFSYVVPLEDLKHIYLFLRKKLILFKKISKCAVSRKVKKRYIELEISDKRHRNSVVSGGLYNTISRNTSTEKHPGTLLN